MSRRKKVVLGVVILLVVTLVALVVIVPLLFNLDRYRPQVAALIEQQMGKPTEIGHLALTVFPRLSIRVDDFALKNPPGFPADYYVKARRIYAVIDAGELWKHEVVIKSLELEAPAISLLSGPRGNWNFGSQPHSTKPDPDPPGDKPLFTLGVISNVKISKGTLSVANLMPSGQPGPAFIAAEGVSSKLWQVDLNALTESAGYAAESTRALVAEGTFEMDTLHVMGLAMTKVKSKLHLFPKQVFLDGLEFKCYDGAGGGDLYFAFPGPNPRYSTQAKLSGLNAAKVLDAIPEVRGKLTGTLDGAVTLEGELSHSPDPLAGIGGSGHFAIRNGRLPSLQWNANLLQLSRVAKMGPATGDPSSFSSIAIDFTIANNRINTTQATIVGNGVEVEGSGSLGLAGRGDLNYQGVARVVTSQNALTTILRGISGATLENGKMAFHFKITGTLQNPQFTLMPSAAVSQKGTGKGAKP
jgi:hypothetical protein